MKRLTTAARDPMISVGTVVEFTQSEIQTLKQVSNEMDRLTFHMPKGWLLPYLNAHRAARRVIDKAFVRAHSTDSIQTKL